METDLDEARRVFASVAASGADPRVITRQQYGSMIVRELLTRDLDQAIAFSDGEFIWWNASIEKLAAEVGKQRGVDGLLRWIDNVEYCGDEVSELDYKKVAARTALAIVIGEEPGRARSWVIANAGQPYADGDTIQRIAMAVDENPGLQLTWLAELPIGASERRDRIAGIFSGYLSSDLDAAVRWLAEQDLGPIYDLAIQQVADAAAEFDREGARTWAGEISDEALRAATLKRLDLLE
ncbi:MAG: hypothetical protein HKN82_00270 [Akkermansiaceae bacterium]|nr:hypothetical protein [Akkermansiaceae bacterium]NNM30019.1 hypothetical protein [Akkermansiaceae bacterium]